MKKSLVNINLLQVDFDYFYFQISRNILVNKYIILSRHKIPQIIRILYFFVLVKIADLDDVQIYNYLYLFKYFFGRIAYLTKIKSFFNLGK